MVEYKRQYSLDATNPGVTCDTGTGICDIEFEVEADMKEPIFVYYELTNFYQNHRRYVKSRSDAQLSGTVYIDPNDAALKTACDPLTEEGGEVLHPCGLIAHSYFNDVIDLTTTGFDMDETGIAWKSDVEKKFNNIDKDSHPEVKYITEIYPELSGVADEHFVVWMRPAALPTFRKLYGRIHKDVSAGTTLTFQVESNFDVESFHGTKSIVISTASFMGGKNPFLGYAYIVVGAMCILAAFVFAIRQALGGRKLGDASFLVYPS